jgi:PAS domain S-box-containing protein
MVGPWGDGLHAELFRSLPEAAVIFEVAARLKGAPVDFVLLDANPAFHSLMGLAAGEQKGRRLSEFSFADQHLERLASVAASLEPIRYEVYEPAIDKHLRVSAFLAGAGRVGVTLRDATAERIVDVERARWLEDRAQVGSRLGWTKARETEELFRTTVENIPVNLVLYDRDLKVLYINPLLAAMAMAFGRGATQIVGRAGSEVWPDFIWNRLQPACERALRTGERQDYELDVTMPSGSRVIRQWTIVPILGARGDVQHLLAMTHDLTAQRRLLHELQEVDRRKSDFIAVLSHELRNPLAAMQTNLDVLERAPSGSDAAARARPAIERQVQHLARLVDDLLDVTRIARNKITLQRVVVDLREVVRETMEDHRARLDASGVRFQVDLPVDPVPVDADPARIAQIVANLVAIAAKFTLPGGMVAVSVSQAESVAVLRVGHSGSGIDPALLRKLFVPFTRADRTLGHAGGGLGLGLALVKGLVDLHGGEVEACSAGEGEGTEILVRLPLERTASVAPPAPSATYAPLRRRVLIIEDESGIRDGLRAALEFDHHQVEASRTGAEGLEAARRFKPDVVLCDIGLPGMDGYDVARAFRSDPALCSIFLVALTGYAQSADIARAKEAGFDRHLAKPATMRKIQEAIAAAANRGSTRNHLP